jgi:hypothetical protein
VVYHYTSRIFEAWVVDDGVRRRLAVDVDEEVLAFRGEDERDREVVPRSRRAL